MRVNTKYRCGKLMRKRCKKRNKKSERGKTDKMKDPPGMQVFHYRKREGGVVRLKL